MIPAIGLFFALTSQWRWAGQLAFRTGLEYAAIEPTARMAGIELTPLVFSDLRTLEGEALRVFNAKH